MIQIRQLDKTLILGDYRTGKTFRARALLAGAPKYAVWDPTMIFPGGTSDWRRFTDNVTKTGRGIFQPGRGHIAERFEAFCEFTFTLLNTLVFVDEPAMAAKAANFPQSFIDLHRLGHKRGNGVMIASHSLWDLPHVTQQNDHLLIFRIRRVVDINALSQMVEAHVIDWVKKAPDWHFWYDGQAYSGPMDPKGRPMRV